MAQQYPCDICQQEPAAQMLTNTESGAVMMLGLACLPVFYANSVLALIGSGPHTKIVSKCQACRRVHEIFTVIPDQSDDTGLTESPEVTHSPDVPE